MFLLIPQEQKKKLLKQYRLRLLFIVIAFLSILIAYGVFSLLPAYFTVHSEEQDILTLESSLQQSIREKSNGDLEKTLSNLKQNIEVLQSEDRDVISIVNLIVENKPVNVHITKFNYLYNPDDISVFEVGGVADDRTSLIKFSKNLQANPQFSKVDLPISNLAKDSNIDFNITITGSF